MDVFRSFPAHSNTISKPRTMKKSRGRTLIQRDQDDKPFRSEREIRDKISKHMAKKAPVSSKVKGKKMGMSYLEEQDPVMGDIKKNDPNDPMTREKLKTLLGSGAVQFGDKERAVLSKILA